MMRTILWKEYREHRLIWLTMMVVNSGALLGMLKLDSIISPPRAENSLSILGPTAALLIWGYGMICGAMLLAGEREEGTLKFLDTLPVSRFRLWLAKGQIGLLLVCGQIVVLCGSLAAICGTEEPNQINGASSFPPFWVYALGMLILGLIGMAYGLFFSARGENVLHTIGLAIVGQIAAWIVAGFSVFALVLLLAFSFHFVSERPIFGHRFARILEGPYMVFFVFAALTFAATAGSARIFCRGDRQRKPVAVRRMHARASLVASWLRIVWLCDRQMRRLALGVLSFSLGLGVLFLVAGPLVWPVSTLLLGVLCGVTVFSDEQTIGSFRYLGDQRLPLGRIWIIKTAARFALLLLASFLLLLPSLLVALFHHSDQPNNAPGLRILGEILHLSLIGEVTPIVPYLSMWLLYGFCAGQLCGFLSRKSIVAAMIAVMTSALLVIVWLPSLVGIGLHVWQIAGPPLILLVAAVFLLRPWAADRLASLKTYLGVSVAMAASLLCLAFGIWYRVIEIPDVPEPFDVASYIASLPATEENEAGRLIRGVWGHVESAVDDMVGRRDKKQSLGPELAKILEDGWPDGPSKLGEWMDKTFAEDWLPSFDRLPDLPLGMLVDPRLMTLHSILDSIDFGKWDRAIAFSGLLAARGLQQQARGDPVVFVKHMRIALALSRNLRHHSVIGTHLNREIERVWLETVDLWLKKLRGRPDLLERALQTLIDHEAKLPDREEPFRAAYVMAQNTLEQPEEMLSSAIDMMPSSSNGGHDQHQAELQTAALLWLFPWEQARHRRLLRVEFGGTAAEQRKSREEWGGIAFAVFDSFAGRFRRNLSLREAANLHACQLKLALRWYQKENGDLPATLDVLAPRYLKSIPRDPFSGQPFHFRRSRGEWIAWPKPLSALSGPPGMLEAPGGEVPLMPRADERAVQPPDRKGMPNPELAGVVDDRPPPDGVPLMPRADERAGPRLNRRIPRRGMANGQLEQPPMRWVPKGQGILWSIGEDSQDDGAVEQSINLSASSLGQDLIYLVPPPP